MGYNGPLRTWETTEGSMGKEEGGLSSMEGDPPKGFVRTQEKNQSSESIGPGGTICQVAGMSSW